MKHMTSEILVLGSLPVKVFVLVSLLRSAWINETFNYFLNQQTLRLFPGYFQNDICSMWSQTFWPRYMCRFLHLTSVQGDAAISLELL